MVYLFKKSDVVLCHVDTVGEFHALSCLTGIRLLEMWGKGLVSSYSLV